MKGTYKDYARSEEKIVLENFTHIFINAIEGYKTKQIK